MQEIPYIPPNLLIAASFEQLMEDYEKYGSYFTWLTDASEIAFKDLPRHNLVFIVADPGQGKSRLLKEIANQLQLNNRVVRFDLKLLGDRPDLEKEVLGELKAESFDAITDNVAVTFDGLDEVAANQILLTVNSIKKYIAKHSSQKIFIASRLHFFSKHRSHFSEFSAEYVLITPLSSTKAVKFLKSFGIRDETIALITKTLRLRDGTLMIQNPRYLGMLTEWVKDNPDKLHLIDRAKIFNHFVDKALISENSIGDDIATLKRRFLEKLALTMETAQKDVITKDELMTFIDEANSDVATILLGKISFEDLYQHALLKENKDTLMFLNAEIQEYLASKATSRLKDPWRSIFDLAVDPHLREVYPSWINTMSFVIDEVPSVLDAFLNLYSKKTEEPRVENDLLHKVLSNVSPHLINDDQREKLFKWVFNYYLSHKLWLDSNDLASNLAFLVTDTIKIELAKLTTQEFPTVEDRYYTLGNVVRVVKYIQEQGNFSGDEENFWKQKLVEYSKDDNSNGVLQRTSLYGLVFFNDDNVLEEVKIMHDSEDEAIRNSFEGLCLDLNPNHPVSVNAFIAGIKDIDSPYSRHGFTKISSPDALTTVITRLSTEQSFLSNFIKRNSGYDDKEDTGLLQNIHDNWQMSWLEPLKKIVSNSNNADHGYYAERSTFIKRLVLMIAEHDTNYFKELLEEGSSAESGTALHYMDSHLSRIMKLENLPLLVEKINEHEDKKYLLFRVVQCLGFSGIDNPHADVIEKEARIQLVDLYAEHDAKVAEYSNKKDDVNKTVEDLILLLTDVENGSYVALLNGLQTAVRDAENIDVDAHRVVLDKLWEAAKSQIIEKYEPSEATFRINDRVAGQTTYTLSNFINHFVLALKYAIKYKYAIDDYKQKFISLTPYVYPQDFDDFLELLSPLSNEEIRSLLASYEDLESDLATYNIENVLHISKRFHIPEAVPILNGIVDSNSPKIDKYRKKEAIETSEIIKADHVRLKSLFERLKTEPEEKMLLLQVARLLIVKHGEKDAFHWLINYLKDSAFVHVTPTGMHSVGADEHELHEGSATQPLKDIAEPEYIEEMIRLLDFSIELIERGERWHNYAFYLWKPVEAYFKNLISTHSYKPLLELENYIEKNIHRPGMNWFLRTYSEIKQAYMAEMGKVSTFSDAIQRVNKLNLENYLPVRNVQHLYDIVYELINEDLRLWFGGEARKIRGEVIEQKLLLIQLRYILAKRGINPDEVKVLRETQALDDTRTDLLIYYGFYGPVLIEMKLASHGDLAGRSASLRNKESFKSLVGYMQKYEAEHGIFLVYDDVDRKPRGKTWDKHLSAIEEAYSSIEGIKVVGFSFTD